MESWKGRYGTLERRALSEENIFLEADMGLGRAGLSCKSLCSMTEEVGTAGAYASRNGGMAALRDVLSCCRVCPRFLRVGLRGLGEEGQ